MILSCWPVTEQVSPKAAPCTITITELSVQAVSGSPLSPSWALLFLSHVFKVVVSLQIPQLSSVSSSDNSVVIDNSVQLCNDHLISRYPTEAHRSQSLQRRSLTASCNGSAPDDLQSDQSLSYAFWNGSSPGYSNCPLPVMHNEYESMRRSTMLPRYV